MATHNGGSTRIGGGFALTLDRFSNSEGDRVVWRLGVARHCLEKPLLECDLTDAALNDLEKFVRDARGALNTDGGRAASTSDPENEHD